MAAKDVRFSTNARDKMLRGVDTLAADWPGVRRVNIIKTGERSYCIFAEWPDMEAIANARPQLIATLDTFRDTLEDLGGGLGVTDPISGPVVLELK